MKNKKINIKKVLYITLLVVLTLVFVASLTFGALAAFTTTVREDIEIWYASKYEKEISLLSTSIKWLLASAALLVLTLSFKDFKKKYLFRWQVPKKGL